MKNCPVCNGEKVVVYQAIERTTWKPCPSCNQTKKEKAND